MFEFPEFDAEFSLDPDYRDQRTDWESILSGYPDFSEYKPCDSLFEVFLKAAAGSGSFEEALVESSIDLDIALDAATCLFNPVG